jgi:hypothetical protein
MGSLRSGGNANYVPLSPCTLGTWSRTHESGIFSCRQKHCQSFGEVERDQSKSKLETAGHCLDRACPTPWRRTHDQSSQVSGEPVRYST